MTQFTFPLDLGDLFRGTVVDLRQGPAMYESPQHMRDCGKLKYDRFDPGSRIWGGQHFYEVLSENDPAPHIVGADGVKIKCLPGSCGYFNFDAIIPNADGVTDDYPKLLLLMEADITGRSARPIHFSNGRYFMSQTINLKRQHTFLGNSSGLPWNDAATFVFPEDTAGIICNRFDTLGHGLDDNTDKDKAGDGSVVRGINLEGGGGTDPRQHGVHLRARAIFERMIVRGFAGSGCAAIASAKSSDPYRRGNANGFQFRDIRSEANKQFGYFADGPDVNASCTINTNAAGNVRGGFRESSFLGVTHLAPQAATNGVPRTDDQGNEQSPRVTFGGNRYYAHWHASEQDLVDTEPGTDNEIWVLEGSGGTGPRHVTWVASSPVGTYYPAFAFYFDGDTAPNALIGAYGETDQAGSVFLGPTMVVGGHLGGVLEGEILKKDSDGKHRVESLTVAGEGLSISFGINNALMTWSSDDLTHPYRLKSEPEGLYMDWANLSGERVFSLPNSGDIAHRLDFNGFGLNGVLNE